MDTHLQHDPRTKKQIKEAIYSFLYNPVFKNFQRKLEVLITKNSVLCGNAEMSFNYKNETYCTPGAVLPRKMNRLHKSLHIYMDEYLKEIHVLNSYELPYVLGFINQVLNSSNDLQDYLLVFPASLHPPIEGLINSCPCRTNRLTLDEIHLLQGKNHIPINLLKQRQVINLII
jgi:hypothetical protein